MFQLSDTGLGEKSGNWLVILREEKNRGLLGVSGKSFPLFVFRHVLREANISAVDILVLLCYYQLAFGGNTDQMLISM